MNPAISTTWGSSRRFRHHRLYLDLPDRAVVFTVDEKSQIEALEGTQPGLPLNKRRCGTMTQTTSAMARPRCSRRARLPLAR